MLDCDKSSVRRAEVRGDLNPQIDAAGVRRFRPDEVEELRVRRGVAAMRSPDDTSGIEAAKVFAELRVGRPAADIVVALAIAPERVLALLQTFNAMMGSIVIPKAKLDQLRGELALVDADVVDGPTLVDAIIASVSERCAWCRARTPKFCAGCAQPAARAIAERERAQRRAEAKAERQGEKDFRAIERSINPYSRKR